MLYVTINRDLQVRQGESGKSFMKNRCLAFIILITFMLKMLEHSE